MDESSFKLSFDVDGTSKSEKDSWKDANSSMDTDVGEDSRTYVDKNDAQSDSSIDNPVLEKFGSFYRKWDWLNQVHNGRTSQSRSVEKARNDVFRDAKTFCSQLDIGDYQRQRVLRLLKSVESFENGSIPSEAVVFAAISLVANEDGWRIRREDIFLKLRDDRGVSSNQIREMRKDLHEHL